MTTAAAASDGPLSFCRDCLGDLDIKVKRCSHCGSPRLVRHRALPALALAHIDCDAFYATVEKRDNPEIADRPVIIGGGKRGVVSAACYIARTYGVRSAMPMFKALELCPDATVIPPDMRQRADAKIGRKQHQGQHGRADRPRTPQEGAERGVPLRRIERRKRHGEPDGFAIAAA